MNHYLNMNFFHNNIKDWAISFAIIIFSFLVAKIVFWLSKNIFKKATSKTQTELDNIFVDQLDAPLSMAVVFVCFYFAVNRLTFPESLKSSIENIFHFLVTIAVTWFIVRVVNQILTVYFVPFVKKSDSNLDDQLLPILRKGVTIGVWGLGIIVGLNNAGVNVGALVAGMGIGGFAFAMAAKDTLSNFFGGITVFTDKPFRVGDRIKIDSFDGTVTEIGLRSTRLATLEGRVVTIPNSKFIDGVVENVTLEPTRKVKISLGLVYDTTPQKMELAIALIRSIIKDHKDTTETDFTHFVGYGDFSLNILLIYHIKKDADIFLTQTQVNLKILNAFNDEGLGFAFPTTTLDIPKNGAMSSTVV